jgi:signal transduction histidine kinase
MSEKTAKRGDRGVQAVYQTGKPVQGFAYELTRGDGTRYYVESNVSLIRDAAGQPVGFRGISRDITERKRAEFELQKAKEEAEAASRSKSEFLANMSHEIRTPMNGIIGMTELMLDTELNREQHEYLDMIKTSADALLTVINDILDFSKIEAGKLSLDPVAFDLRENVEETMKTLALRAHQKGLELACYVHPDVPIAVVGDPMRLRQILVNLAGNAIKFTKQGEVVVEESRAGERESERVGDSDIPASPTLPLSHSPPSLALRGARHRHRDFGGEAGAHFSKPSPKPTGSTTRQYVAQAWA